MPTSSKRPASPSPSIANTSVAGKKFKVAAVKQERTGDTPFDKLYSAMTAAARVAALPVVEGGVVVYWMRNKDLRLRDNTALAAASAMAIKLEQPLVIMHILSPSDYTAHHRSPRRIDLQLRRLQILEQSLIDMNVPLHTPIYLVRKEIPTRVAGLMNEWNVSYLYGNIEHEIDELVRDEAIVRASTEARSNSERGWGGQFILHQDHCVIPPGLISTQQGKPYSVYSPWYKNWSSQLTAAPMKILKDRGTLLPNDVKFLTHPIVSKLLHDSVPEGVEGFTLDAEDQARMNHLWPVGDDAVDQIIHRFMKTKIRPRVFAEPALYPGAEEVGKADSKIGVYSTGRNRVDLDGTSRLSPYLAAGIVSARHCLRATLELTNNKINTDKSSSIGVFVSEVAWKDFYCHVLATYPHICRGHSFAPKYDAVVWEVNPAHLSAWQQGKTGFPIVDAGMRALAEQGYMHNRLRMIVAQFLAKDLMLDWRLGEKWFMENLIDGDLASNNLGWQWCASTGPDASPYFRIFAPLAQSTKSDESGDYIRRWVPELAHLKGKALHDPSSLGKPALAKMGYPSPIVDHAKARLRAIARYKTPGCTDNE